MTADRQADVVLTWALIVAVILVVDLAWLLVDVALNQAHLRPATERALNVCLGVMTLGAALAFV